LKDIAFSPSFVASHAGTCCKQAGSGDPAREKRGRHSYFYSYFVSFWDVEFNKTIDLIGVY
jgi:hypothetical protein